jgi:predicted nucleic acid-binding protein
MNICIDSNTITYLFEAIDNYNPNNDKDDNLRNERIAMIRIRFYAVRRLHILPSVRSEIDKISNIDKWLKHKAIVGWLDTRPYNLSDKKILKRKSYFLQFHNQDMDCRILAEAEGTGMNILLSYDNDFKRKLKQKAKGVSIISPSDFFSSLNLAPGTAPLLRPDPSNPLYSEPWWRI